MQCHKSQWKTQSTQDTWNKKEKLVKTNLVLFLLWKRDRKKMKIRWKKFSLLKRYQIFSYRLIPNTENQKKTLIMRKQQPFRGLRKKQKNNSYLLTKWRTKIKFPSVHEIYSGYSRLHTNTFKNLRQKTPWTSQTPRENTGNEIILLWCYFVLSNHFCIRFWDVSRSSLNSFVLGLPLFLRLPPLPSKLLSSLHPQGRPDTPSTVTI